MSNILKEISTYTVGDETTYQLSEYLNRVALNCRDIMDASNSEIPVPISALEKCAADVFHLLTHRKFCYLSGRRADHYRKQIVANLRDQLSGRRPLRFFYDIGGGYHASIRPGLEKLRFTVGLAELFILSQVSIFQSQLLQLYPRGARFSLVVDNLCALFVNDIPIHATESYCTSLRQLINELGLQNIVEVLPESEHFSTAEYQAEIDTIVLPISSSAPSRAETENVSRFLGRSCSKKEAARRIAMYEVVTTVSESHLTKITDGVRMTQRASKSTISFRPFPGGDSRIQAGEVVLTKNAKGAITPLLITSKNASDYELRPIAAPHSFPLSIRESNYAVKV